MPTGIAAAVPGAVLLLIGASQTDDGGGTTYEACGLSGCAEVDAPGGVSSTAALYLGGGGVMTAGGAAMLVAAVAAPPDHASPGRARAAGGGLSLSLGGGTIVMGAVSMATDPHSSVGAGMVGFGVVTSAISVSVLAWGIATLDEGEAGDTYTSSGRIVGGSVLTGVGLLFGAGGTAIMATAGDCSGHFCGLGYAVGSLPLSASATCLGIGLPLLIGGAEIAGDEAVPDVTVGAGDVELRWRFQ